MLEEPIVCGVEDERVKRAENEDIETGTVYVEREQSERVKE